MSGRTVPDAPISARRLASGATWVYGGQLLAAVAQFGYAAVTSRLVGPAEFGVYAITLAISSLVTLIATGGLGQTVGRMHELDVRTIRALCSLAVLLGLASAAVLGLAAPLWALLWSTPSAAPAVAVMSIAAFTAPLTGLMTGLVRRLGHFRLLAAQQLAGTLIGMAVGVVAVLRFQSSESLLVSVIVSQLLIAVFGAWTARGYIGLGGLRSAVHELGFSARLTIASLLSYGVGNITRIVATNVLGAAAIGYWNRAEVISIIPFQQLQTALIQTIYPEFRHDRESADRARRTWTDLMIIMGWSMMLVAAVGAVAVPPLVLILLGQQWQPARALVPVLMFAGAVQAVGTLLAAAIEAIGRFRWVWATQAVLLGLQVLIALSTVLTRSLFLTVVGLLVTGVVRQVWQVWVCARGGYVDGARLARSALWTTVVTVGGWAVLTLLLQLLGATLLNTVLVLAALLVVAVLLRRRLAHLPIARLIAQYGLLPGGRR